MNAIFSNIFALGALCVTVVNCSHKDETTHAKEPRVERDPPTAEQRRIEDRRAEDRRAEDRRAEQRADDRRADERSDNRFVGGGPAEPSSAVTKIAHSRCDREVRCNNVGTKEKYASRADCVTRMQDDKRDDINEKDCPGGIDKKQLNACLVTIRDEACGNSLDSISRLTSCRSSAICLK